MTKGFAGAAAVSALVVVAGLAACGNAAAVPDPGAASPPVSEAPASAARASGMVGVGCEDYASMVPDGAGSMEAMARDPLVTAAGNNPLLRTLVQAVSGELNPQVNLVDRLNAGELTIFAPVDEAFAALDPATVERLRSDEGFLTRLVNHHVLPGRRPPAAVMGRQGTADGGVVNVTGSGAELTVDDARIICGGIKTANATIYLIDSVLMPS